MKTKNEKKSKLYFILKQKWNVPFDPRIKRPFHFCSIFNKSKEMKDDFGQFSIQFLIFRTTKIIESIFFWQFSIQLSIFNNFG